MNEDMRSGGAAAHKAVEGALGSKKEYVQPTHTIATSEGVSSDPKQTHQAFTEEWSEKSVQAPKTKSGLEGIPKGVWQVYPQGTIHSRNNQRRGHVQDCPTYGQNGARLGRMANPRAQVVGRGGLDTKGEK